MSTNKDERNNAELKDERLEAISGGAGGCGGLENAGGDLKPPKPRLGKDLPASELSNDELGSVAGGGTQVGISQTKIAAKQKDDQEASQTP